jgi:hypothetical protein
MKKTIIILLIVVVVLAGLALTARYYLPTMAFRFLGKAINGTVEAGHWRVSYAHGLVVIHLKNIHMKGDVNGTIDESEFRLQPSRVLYIKYLSISGFNVAIKQERGAMHFVPIPVERAEIRKGTVIYLGKKFIIRELTVSDFNTGGTLKFNFDGGAEGWGDLKSFGAGIFKENQTDLSGRYVLSNVNMSLLKGYQGYTNSQGTFTYKGDKLTFDGVVSSSRMVMFEKFQTKAIVASGSAKIHFVLVGKDTDFVLREINYQGVPFTLSIATKGKMLARLDLESGFIKISSVREYINMEQFSQKGWGPLSFVKSGEVKIDRLNVINEKLKVVQVRLRGVEAGNEKVVFNNVEGSLRIENELLVLSSMKGMFGKGRVQDINGKVPLQAGRDVSVKGTYQFDLQDLANLKEQNVVRVLSGSTSGLAEITGNSDEGFNVRAAGTLEGGQFKWKNMPIAASGNYSVADNVISFDPLLVKSGKTDLVLTGKAGQDMFHIKPKGTVDAVQVSRLLPRRFPLDGTVDIDGEVESEGGIFSARGTLGMDDLSFRLLDYVKKERGVKSSATVAVRSHEKDTWVINDIDYRMGMLHARASGTADKKRISDLHLTMDLPGLDKMPDTFFFNKKKLTGDIQLDVEVGDLPYHMDKLPLMNGYFTIHEGTFQLASFNKPFEDIDLACDFRGDIFKIAVNRLRIGQTVLSTGTLNITDAYTPVFSLSTLWETFDVSDFGGQKKWKFELPVIEKDSLLSRTRGDFLIRTGQLKVRDVSGSSLSVEGTFDKGALHIEEGKAVIGGGALTFEGDADFRNSPHLSFKTGLRDGRAEEVFGIMNPGSKLIEGAASVDLDLAFTGKTVEDLARSASGTAKISSSNGVIRKWNLISKLLAVLNLYDLLRGQVDLTRTGLSYKTLAASFKGANGIFRTNDFLINSSAMMITGRGNLNVGTRQVDAKMTVSPLVTIDRIINHIPLIRTIFREKKRGFLFVVYDVKGPIEDPDVTSSYVSSFGKRAANLFFNLFQLPKEVLDYLPKDSSESNKEKE